VKGLSVCCGRRWYGWWPANGVVVQEVVSGGWNGAACGQFDPTKTEEAAGNQAEGEGKWKVCNSGGGRWLTSSVLCGG